MEIANEKKNKIAQEKLLEPIVFVKKEFKRDSDNVLNILNKCIKDQGVTDEEKHNLGIN